MGDISNNCALQGVPKCHVKGFFVIFNFSLKTFCLKKLFDLSDSDFGDPVYSKLFYLKAIIILKLST